MGDLTLAKRNIWSLVQQGYMFYFAISFADLYQLRWRTLVFLMHIFAQSNKTQCIYTFFRNCFDTIFKIKHNKQNTDFRNFLVFLIKKAQVPLWISGQGH